MACSGRTSSTSARARGCQTLLTGGRTCSGGRGSSTTTTQVAAGLDLLVPTSLLCAGLAVFASTVGAGTPSGSAPTTDPSCGSTTGTPSTTTASMAGAAGLVAGTCKVAGG